MNSTAGVRAGSRFAEVLIGWYRRGHRELPWRETRDPYRIWISEIMLQQTRAQAAIPYYERFLARFPSVESLAEAKVEDVLAVWSGLGYYSRARNLHRAAQAIAASGSFPCDYDGLRQLPGIGDYTAAAITSIAYDLPHAVLDGNVLRVVARVENDAADIGSVRTRDRFRETAQAWLDTESPGEFNQALMELGATVCAPRNPVCMLCPVAEMCKARDAGTVAQLPVKLRRTAAVHLDGVLLVIVQRGRILLRRRDADARRMPGFWELPTPEELPAAKVGERIGEIRHTITHHHYRFEVRRATCGAPKGEAFRWFTEGQLATVPFSSTARKALRLAGFSAPGIG